jgi:uncharacterized protein YbjT (DUF2867 family)
MSSSTDRVFILGGTGNIGTRVVQDLLAKKVPVTLYARTPSKVESLFPNHNGLINVVQGDYSDLTPLKASIKGHTRLFLLILGFKSFVEDKAEIAKIAYEAGVKQIVDISSFTVNMGWRTSLIGAKHDGAERAILNIPNRGYFVALRPGGFMSNMLYNDTPLKTGGKIFDSASPDCAQGWISTNDIGAVAAVVLSEDIEKHGDAVYSLTGDIRTPTERAQVLSRILGQDIKFIQVTSAQKYSKIMKTGYFTHQIAMDLCTGLDSYNDDRVTPEISILLGRDPETLEEYLTVNKSAYLQ